MSLTYVWSLTKFKKQNTSELNNVIVQTFWKKTGTDENGVSATFRGATPFDLSSVDPNNFIAYEDLTEEIILSWIQTKVSNDDIQRDHIDQSIQENINKKISSTVESLDFPWSVGVGTISISTPGGPGPTQN